MKFLRMFPLLFIFFSAAISAHDQFLVPDPFRLNPSEQSQLLMFLTLDEIAWFGSETVNISLIGPTGDKDLTALKEDNPVLVFPQEGTYVVGWQSVANYIRIEPQIFNKYIRMEGYSNVIQARAGRDTSPGKERYTRYLKTFIQVGHKETDHFKKTLGYKIEIVPLQNPYSLSLNSDLEVQIIYDGRPLAGRRVMATYTSYSEVPEDYAQVVVSDPNGIARFRITHKGIWMIRTNQIIPRSGDPEADWESFWANATFRID